MERRHLLGKRKADDETTETNSTYILNKSVVNITAGGNVNTGDIQTAKTSFEIPKKKGRASLSASALDENKAYESTSEDENSCEDMQECTQDGEKTNMTVRVIKSLGIKKYRNGRQRMSYYRLQVGTLSLSNSTTYSVRHYLHGKIKIKVGYVYKLGNVVRKPDLEEYWLVSGSTVLELDASDQKRYPNDQVRTITAALKTCYLSTVVGKIVKTSKLKMQKRRTWPVRPISIKGKNGTAELILFGEDAKRTYSIGDQIEASGVYSALNGEIWTSSFSRIKTNGGPRKF